MNKKILIIGAGPCGLGAAYRLQELGHSNWKIYEANPCVGGLSRSMKDDKGFIWDIGGHVIFSHYPYFDALFEKLLSGQYAAHTRSCWIRIMSSFVPYPFQNNLNFLPPDITVECLLGLIKAQNQEQAPSNFKEWTSMTFGEGISKYFMHPYNSKVWAHPLEEMSFSWVAERVSAVDLKKILESVVKNTKDTQWGPNNQFKFPLHGGTGGLFEKIVPFIKDHLFLNKEAVSINTAKKEISFSDGSKERYDALISTMPLNEFIRCSDLHGLEEAADSLRYSSVLAVGVGLKGETPSDKTWLYFPESDCPFYRVTYFSNYSPNNAPEGCWSLLTEVSHSEYKHEDKGTIVEKVIEGLKNTGLITSKMEIVDTYVFDAKHAYPTPTLGRDAALAAIQSKLMELDIYSRGRFGAWMYETGNMDHSVMQGVEAVNKILLGADEMVWRLKQ